jgi:membrane fusion protein, heavy metal efflux system
VNRDTATHPRVSTRTRRTLAIAAIVIGLGVVALRWHAPAPVAAPAATAVHTFQPTEAQLATLAIAPVTEATFRTEIATEGAIAYDEETLTPVYSPYSGRVTRVVGHLGDRVRRGQVLYDIAGSEYAQGQSDLATTRAALDTARANEHRLTELLAAGAAAERDVLQARADRVAAEAAWSAARARLTILGQTDPQLDALETKPAGAPVVPVTSPVDGVITQRAATVGQYVQSAAAGAGTPVFVVADVRTVWVIGWVREADAAAVRAGQAADITVPALAGTVLHGTVRSVASGLDPANHRLAVRIAVPNPDGRLKPEMYAEVRIGLADASRALAVPTSAIVYDGDVTRVFVESGGTIVGRNVRLGRRLGPQAEVLDGLRPGERIVTSSTLFVDHAVAGE